MTVAILSFRSTHRYMASTSGIEIPIRIRSTLDNGVELLAKIDTGAAFCIFQREHAEELGLDVERGIPQSIWTAIGPFETYGHTVTLSCLEYEFDSLVYFARQYDFPRNVLGLKGWLDKLRFGLVHYDESLYLSLYDDS